MIRPATELHQAIIEKLADTRVAARVPSAEELTRHHEAARDPLPDHIPPPVIRATPDPSLSPREVRAAQDALQYCQDWQHAISDVCESINRGDDPRSAVSSRLTFPDGRTYSVAGFLDVVTNLLAHAASVRYDWFDVRPLYEASARVAAWGQGIPSRDEGIALSALVGSIGPRLARLQREAMIDLGFIPSLRKAPSSPPAPAPADPSPEVPVDPADEQDTNSRVAEKLRANPRAKSDEIARAIGKSAQRVRTTLAWKEHQERRRKQGQKPSVQTRPLTPAMLAAVDAKADDPADIAAENEEQEMQERARPDDVATAEQIEVLERKYLEGADANERARFHRLSPADQEHELRAWQWTGNRLAD
jgi:hypothetical protein